MVTYDREFLVPYLKNLCALYYAKRKLEQHLQELQQNISINSTEVSLVRPQYEVYDNEVNGGHGCAFALSGVFLLPALGLLTNPQIGEIPSMMFAVILFIIIGVVILVLTFNSINDYKEINRQRSHRNDQLREEVRIKNKQIEAENQRRNQILPRLKGEARILISELENLNELIARSYSANIIPGNYREMYCVVYLYDYFSKSRSNDMDIALNTYVLEQIKAKLDIIIQNQSDMLLNQELMLANQERALEERREHHKRLESKIDRMNCELEEANQYRQVIHSDLETLEFFARDSYIRRICS